MKPHSVQVGASGCLVGRAPAPATDLKLESFSSLQSSASASHGGSAVPAECCQSRKDGEGGQLWQQASGGLAWHLMCGTGTVAAVLYCT
jgi:hypothetical protein